MQMNFLFEFAFEAGVDDVLAGAEDFDVVDVAAHADGTFAMEPLFGLAIGAFHAEEFFAMAHDDVGDDLFVGGIVLSDGTAEEGLVGEDVFQGAIEIGGGEVAGEEWVDAGSWDDEDVFVHAAMVGIVPERGNRFVI